MSCTVIEINEYYLGSVVRVTAIFRDEDGVLIDPDQVNVKWEQPDGTIDGVTDIPPDTTGHFHYDIPTSAGVIGRWFYKWYSTGEGEAVKEGQFDVIATEVP